MKLVYNDRIKQIKASKDFKNIFFSLVSYFIIPIFLLVSTPILLRHLGAENYGIWILINSIVTMLSISNFGLGSTIIKLGAEYDTDKSPEDFNKLFNVIFSVTLVLSVIILIFSVLLGNIILPYLVHSESVNKVLKISSILGAIVVFRMISSVIAGTYLSKQRYDLNSKVNIVISFVTSIAYVLIAYIFKSIEALIIALLISSIFTAIITYYISKRELPFLEYKIDFNKVVIDKVLKYSLYSWFQVVIGVLYSQADKLIIGGILGTTALGYYTICMQLAVKIQEVPSASFSYMLAKFSSLQKTADSSVVKKSYFNASKLTFIFILVISIPLIFYSKLILSLWIDSAFSEKYTFLLQSLTISVAISSLGIIPYYFLNGNGYIKTNTGVNLGMALVNAGSLFILLPYFGLDGTSIGRIAGVPFIIFSSLYIERKLLNTKGTHTVLQVVIIFFVFSLILLAIK